MSGSGGKFFEQRADKNHSKVKSNRHPPASYHAMAGVLAGAVSTALLHPLDLLKTRFQVQDALPSSHLSGNKVLPRYHGLLHAFQSILKIEGYRGLYQGLTPNVIGSSTSWGLYFLSYTFFKNALSDFYPSKQELGPALNLLAAANAGIITALITNPIWVVKTRLQLQMRKHRENYSGTKDAFLTIAREEGFRGFYKGLVPGLLGVSHGAVQFMSYEEIKKLFSAHDDGDTGTTLGTFHFLVIGGLSKIIAAITTYPFQVVRSRLQQRPLPNNLPKYLGVRDVLWKIWRYEGFTGFYKGILPYILRVTPAAAITFVLYENTIKFLLRSSREEQNN